MSGSAAHPDVPMSRNEPLIGQRVRRLRLTLGLTQLDLSHQLGFERNTFVSRVESGRHELDQRAIATLTTALQCSETYLVGERRELVPPTQPWLRANADAPQKAVHRQIADCETMMDVARILELPHYADSLPQFGGDLDDGSAIESFALEVRADAGLAETDVVGNTIRSAEKLGCLVLPMDGELGRHVGLSTRVDHRPIVCVARASGNGYRVPGDRQRFTVAHELGHLCLHGTTPPPRTPQDARAIENQAHRFAAAFLAPADAVVESVMEMGGRITLRTLEALKVEWGMSIRAFVTRLKHVGLIDQPKAESLFKQISARGWNKTEPVVVPNERGLWLTAALDHVSSRETSSLDEAELRSGLGRVHFERWLHWGIDPTGDSASAPATTHHAPSDSEYEGSVTALEDHRRRSSKQR